MEEIIEQGNENSAQLLSLLQDSISDSSVGISSKVQTGNELMMRLLSQNEQLRGEMAIALSRPRDHISIDRRSNAISSSTAPQLDDSHSLISSSYNTLKCICKRRPTPKDKLVRFPHENGQTRLCPIHGPIRTWSYHATANLSPFLNGALELTLGFLTTRRGFSMLPSLRFHGMVKRSESHLFVWFDDVEGILRQRASMIRNKALKSNTIQWQPLSPRQIARVVNCMSCLVEGIRRSIALGKASGSDTDENGRTLLFVSQRVSLVDW